MNLATVYFTYDGPEKERALSIARDQFFDWIQMEGKRWIRARFGSLVEAKDHAKHLNETVGMEIFHAIPVSVDVKFPPSSLSHFSKNWDANGSPLT